MHIFIRAVQAYLLYSAPLIIFCADSQEAKTLASGLATKATKSFGAPFIRLLSRTKLKLAPWSGSCVSGHALRIEAFRAIETDVLITSDSLTFQDTGERQSVVVSSK